MSTSHRYAGSARARHRPVAALQLVAVAACFAASPLSAQVVYGTAHVAAQGRISQASNVGSSATSVVLVDTTGSLVTGAITKEDRAFSIRGATSLRGSTCPRGIPLYLNGNAMNGNSLSVVAPSEIAAIEYYATPETMPASIRSSPCGVILIWTK